MNIRPATSICHNYNEIADMCRKTAEPIFLTQNGEGDLVVMDIDTYNRREKMLKLREELLAVEEESWPVEAVARWMSWMLILMRRFQRFSLWLRLSIIR